MPYTLQAETVDWTADNVIEFEVYSGAKNMLAGIAASLTLLSLTAF